MYSESKLYPNHKNFLDIFWTYFVQFAKLQNLHQYVQKVSKMCPNFWTHLVTMWPKYGHILDKNLDTFCGKITGPPVTMRARNIVWTQCRHILDIFWTHFKFILDTLWTHLGHMPLGCIAYLPWTQSSDTKIKYI